jgi:hypothetical protein
VRNAAINFLCLSGVCVAIAAAAKLGFIDHEATQRALGIAIGCMMVDIGNLLPKLGPLNRSPEPGKVLAAERFAGWTLVLGGLVFVSLFAVLPLDRANLIAGAVGISALVLIAANWSRFLLRRSSGAQQSYRSTVSPRRRVSFSILFALAYILCCACSVFLLGPNDKLALWTTVGFSCAFACYWPLVRPRPPDHGSRRPDPRADT